MLSIVGVCILTLLGPVDILIDPATVLFLCTGLVAVRCHLLPMTTHFRMRSQCHDDENAQFIPVLVCFYLDKGGVDCRWASNVPFLFLDLQVVLSCVFLIINRAHRALLPHLTTLECQRPRIILACLPPLTTAGCRLKCTASHNGLSAPAHHIGTSIVTPRHASAVSQPVHISGGVHHSLSRLPHISAAPAVILAPAPVVEHIQHYSRNS